MKLIPFDPMHPLEKAENGVASGDVRSQVHTDQPHLEEAFVGQYRRSFPRSFLIGTPHLRGLFSPHEALDDD